MKCTCSTLRTAHQNPDGAKVNKQYSGMPAYERTCTAYVLNLRRFSINDSALKISAYPKALHVQVFEKHTCTHLRPVSTYIRTCFYRFSLHFRHVYQSPVPLPPAFPHQTLHHTDVILMNTEVPLDRVGSRSFL